MADRVLPEGWSIVGLFHEGEGTSRVSHRDVTDHDVATADAIIVEYKSRRTGTAIHRTVHGASSKRGIGDIIRHTIRVVSPRGSSRRDP